MASTDGTTFNRFALEAITTSKRTRYAVPGEAVLLTRKSLFLVGRLWPSRVAPHAATADI